MPIGWTDNWEEQLVSVGINCLYHVTDKDNFQSIGKERGLSSWRKLTEDGLAVPRPGGDAVSHALDIRYGQRDDSVHLFATEPSQEQLKRMMSSGRFGELCVVTISLKAIRPGSTVFWIGDPYDGGERIDNVTDLVSRLHNDESALRRITVDIQGSVHMNHIGNIPDDVWTRISEVHPTAIVFVIDQSCSMARGTDVDNVEYDYISELAALSVNKQIEDFLKRCISNDGTINHLYDIAVIGYGEDVSNAWSGALSEKDFHTPMELLSYVKNPSDAYRWVEPKDDATRGRCDLAFRYVDVLLEEWIKKEENRFSYPPTVIHISDGNVKRDYQREFLLQSEKLKRLQTEVGHVIIWNISYLPARYKELVFLSGEEISALSPFPDGLVLYEASSYLPDRFKKKAALFHRQDAELDRKTMGINMSLKTLCDALQLCVLPE